MNARKPEPHSPQELVPVAHELSRPMVPEFVVGEYYYGHQPAKSAVARSYVQMLTRQRWVILLSFILLMELGLVWVFSRPQLYRSKAEVLVAPAERGGMPGGTLEQNIALMTSVRSVSTEIKMLHSPDLLDEAFATLPAKLRATGFQTKNTKLAVYPVAIENPKDTDVIGIEVTARNPEAAATFANAIIATHLQRRQATMQGLATMATEHVTRQLADCDAALQQTLHQMARYKRNNNVADISVQIATDASALANLESQATEAASALEQARARRATLVTRLRTTSPEILSSVTQNDNPLVATIDAEIEQLHKELAEKLQEYQPTASEVRDVNERIAKANKRKEDALVKKAESRTHARNPLYDDMQKDYINAIVAEQEASKRLTLTKGQSGVVRGRLDRLPASEQHLALLTSKIQELQTTHAYLTQQKEALSLKMQTNLPSVISVTKGRANPKPASPNIPASLALLVVIVSLISLSLAVLRDQLDERIHTGETLENMAGRRILATLPRVKNGFHGLIVDQGCPPALLESFRILRGNILLSMPEPLPRIIMLTSPRPGEGKSTTTANLAASIAMSGKRVLIIDCDLRHPSIHQIYDLPNEIGLSMVLAGETAGETAIQPTTIQQLDVMTAGPVPAYPPELLASSEFPSLLAALRDTYDCILLDSTPLVNLSDGAMLAAHAEGVLVVVASGYTRYPDLNMALRVLEQVGAPILGLIHNRSDDVAAVRWSNGRDVA
jgi:succinoglycan biosynthesis transport protein ExoP